MKKIQLIAFIWSIVALSCFAQAPAQTNVYTNYTGWTGTTLNLANQGPNNVTLTGSITTTSTIASTGTTIGGTGGNSSPEYKYINITPGNSTTTVTINFSSPVRDLILPAVFYRFGTTGSYVQGSYTTPGNVVTDLSPDLHSNGNVFAIHGITDNRYTHNYNDENSTNETASRHHQQVIWTADGDVSSVTLVFENFGTNAGGDNTQIRFYPMTWLPTTGGTQPSENPDLDAQLCEGINVAFLLDRSGSMDADELDSVRQGVQIALNELEGATAVNKAMMITFGNTPVLGVPMTDITAASISPGGVHYDYLNNVYAPSPESTNWQDALIMATNQVNAGTPIDMVVLVSDGYPNKDDNVASQGFTSYYLDEIIPFANTLKNLGTHVVIFGTGGLTQNSGQEVSSYVTDQTEPLQYSLGSDVREVDYAIADNFSDFPPLFLNFFNDCVTQANFPPVAVNDFYTTPLNTTLVINAANGITPNDNDPDGDPLSVVTTPISGPQTGSITISADGSFTYIPNTGFFGVDSILYQTCDPGGLCDTAYIYITVEKTELQLIKTATYNDANGNMCLDIGEVVTYTFTINNIGNVSVSQITLEDPIIGITEYACGTGSLGGGKTRSCTADYTVLPADFDNGGIINSATVNGIDANSAAISDVSSNSTATPSTPTEINTCECTRPALTLGPISCDGTSFTVEFFTDETISNVSHGTVSGGSIINVPFGVTLNVTASNAVLGCDITQSVIIPATCPNNCVFPDLSVGQPICTGTTYGVIFNESTGATVTASAGTVSGNSIINIPIGTDVTVSAANGACISSFVVNSPITCDDPCGNPLVSVSNGVCDAGGAATYVVNYIVTTGATISVSHGTISGNSIINIPSGQDVTVTASLSGCDNTVLVVPAATCPDCVAPALTVGNTRCNASGYSVDFITDGTVTSNVGTVSGNSIINIPFSSNLIVTATSTPGCTSAQLIIIPATCPNNCVFPDLSVGQPICDGTTYSVIFNESTGAVVSTSAGTISGFVISGIPLGTNVTVSASNGDCTASFVVAAPTNCEDPCANPLVGVSNAVCDPAGAATYSVNFVARTGAIVTVSQGTISGNSIVGIPSGQDLTVTAAFAGCDNTVLVVPAAFCPDCVVPALTVGNIRCNPSGFSVDFITDGTVTSNVGTISGNSIINIPLSSNLIVTATSTPGCTSTQTLVIPATCPNNCVFPDLSVGQPICDITTYSVVFNESTGATVSSSAGTISGNIITGIPVGTDVTVSAANGACVASIIVSAPTNCDDPCANPLVGVSNAACNPGGAATYSVNFVARTGAVVSVSHGTISGNSIIGIPSGQDLTVTASFDGCDNTVLVVPAATCPDCVVPALTVGNIRCDVTGFSVDFITDGTVTSNVGTVSGNSITNIPLSSSLIVTATSTPGCVSTQTIAIPATCPNNCVFPDLSVGQPICDGTTYSLIFNESTGATVTASAGTISGFTITGIPVNTDVTVSAANGDCVASFVVTSPTNCDDPCANPLIGVSNAVCAPAGAATYFVNFVARTGAVVTTSHGTISGNSIINIPSGQDVTVTATFDGCSNTVLVVPAATCPDCVVPALTVGNIRCNASGFSVDFITNGTVTSNVGTVSGNSIINIPLSSTLVVTATSTPGCTTTQTLNIPATCPNNCVFPDLSVGQPICDVSTYSVVFNESTGATVSASAGTISGNIITGIPLGTDVTVSAANGACVASFVVSAPTNCGDPCANPLVGVSNGVCDAGGAATYEVNFIARTGATVTPSHGTISGNSIINIPSGQDLTVTASFPGCDNTVLVVPAADCPECIAPALTIGNISCNALGYTMFFISDGTVTTNVGTISGTSILNVPYGSTLIVTASAGVGCTTTQSAIIPATCPTNCVFPDLSVGQPICDVTSYSVVFNESTGATVTASAGTINGFTITGIPLNTDVTVSAANGDCVATFIISAPTNCDDPCANPLVGVSNSVCDPGGAESYFVNFVARTGAVVTVSHGTISGNSIINIPSGQDLTVTASFDGCESTVLVIPAAVCPDCIFPALTVGNMSCTSTGFSVDFISNATVTSNVGTITGNSINNIPFSSNLVVTATKGLGCTTSQTVFIPATCPTNCFFPDLSVGQPICDGTTYSVVFSESTGATISTTAGSVSGNVVTGIPVGTDIILSATNGDCVAAFGITSPTGCDDPCSNPLVAVSNGICTDDASETYEVQFALTSGATLTVSAGTIDLVNGLIFDIPSGADLTVTASFSGCENTVLVVPAATCECPLVATVDLVDPTDCELNNGSITINATGTNLSYSIDGGISFVDDNIFYALAAGSYDIVIRSSDGGCELAWGVETLTHSASPITIDNIFPTNPSTCVSNDGQIAIAATGIGNVEYSIDGGMTFQPTGLFTGLGLGIYNFIIRNEDGTCPIQAGPIQLTNPSSPAFDFVDVTNSLECGLNDGVISIHAIGGFPPYQYSIDGGASWSNSSTFFQLAEGSYDLAIRNSDGSCALGGLTVDLIAKARPLNAGAIKVNTTCLDDGSLLIAAAGGQNPGSYQVSIDNGVTWVNSASNGITTFTNLAAGTYTPMVRNLDMSCQGTFPDATLLSICADLRVSKTANVAVGNIGEDVVFAVEVCNDGPAAATGVFVDDLLPSGYAYQSYTATVGSYNSFTGIWNITEFGGNLASGSCDTLWVTGTVNATGIYNNIAQVAASDIDDPDSEPNNGVPTEDDQDNVDLPINTVPIAVNDATTTLEDTPVTFDVTNNDDFGANGPSSGEIEIISGPSNGSAAVVNNGSPLDPTDDLISYNPNPNFFGMDTIEYRICDIDTECDTAIYVITILSVDENPTAVDDATITLEDVPVTIDVTSNDDFGGDGPSTTDIVLPDGTNGLQQPSNGTVTLVNGGDSDPTNDEILYTPDPGYNGTDQFAYQICDIDNDCDIAIVDVTITLVDENPIAVDDVTTTLEDTDVTINVTGNDNFGGDGPSLSDITLPNGTNGLIQPTNGTIILVNGGDNDPTNDEVLYSPDPNFHGTDQFEYIICDIDNDCDTALVDITIISVNEFPVAVDDATITNEDTPVTINVTQDDDFMGDGPSTTDINIPDGVNGLLQPSNGSVTLVNGGDNDPTNDEVTYTPNLNFAGTDQFEYEICDSDNDCDIAVVDITVTPINDPPVAINDVTMTDENIPVIIEVLNNDSDVDGILVVTTVDVIEDPLNGTATVNPDGTVTYDPNLGFDGLDTFRYAVCDDGNPNPVLCDTAYAFIEIDQICTDFNISVLLEGSYDGLGVMRTSLNNLHLLPGQDINLSGNPIAPIVGEQTPVGQPYSVSPWNHNGIEGDRYGDPATNTHPDRISYDADVVDWVLVSIRESDSLTTSRTWRCAGLVKSNGSVEFPDECDCLISTPGTKYYVVIEHRNHLPVMSEVIYDVNQELTFDFRIQDSWIYEIVPGFELGVGQKEIATSVYVMFGANGAQSASAFDRRDINSSDNSVWFSQTGTIFKYRTGDFDMNADINSGDNTIWFINAGTSFTQMPLNSQD